MISADGINFLLMIDTLRWNMYRQAGRGPSQRPRCAEQAFLANICISSVLQANSTTPSILFPVFQLVPRKGNHRQRHHSYAPRMRPLASTLFLRRSNFSICLSHPNPLPRTPLLCPCHQYVLLSLLLTSLFLLLPPHHLFSPLCFPTSGSAL